MKVVDKLQPVRRSEPTQPQPVNSERNDAVETAWDTLIAKQTARWDALVEQQQREYNQACAGQIGHLNEVALLRDQLHQLTLIKQQQQEERAILTVIQVRARAMH